MCVGTLLVMNKGTKKTVDCYVGCSRQDTNENMTNNIHGSTTVVRW